MFGKATEKTPRICSSSSFQRTQTRKIYTDEEEDFLLEEVLDRGQRWRIDEKLRQTENFRGDFVKPMTGEGELFVLFASSFQGKLFCRVQFSLRSKNRLFSSGDHSRTTWTRSTCSNVEIHRRRSSTMRGIESNDRRDRCEHPRIVSHVDESLDRVLQSAGRPTRSVAQRHFFGMQSDETGELRRITDDRQ